MKEARWQGNLQEIEAGMLIATPVEDNELGHQFWIGKILDMVLHDIGNTIKSIKVDWYNARSRTAFTGKYTLEMMEFPRKEEIGRGSQIFVTLQPFTSLMWISLSMTSCLQKLDVYGSQESI